MMKLTLPKIFTQNERMAVVTGFLGAVILIFSLAPFPPADDNGMQSLTARPSLSSIETPRELDFAGEEMPIDDPEVRKRFERELLLNLQSDGQIMLYLKRSGEVFDMYDKVLKEAGAPTDLKYLSVAESALFQSQSSAGAVGLWQFIASTGRRYGLRIDEYVDERRHPEKSTRAAARYLMDNYKRYNSWYLAMAAYNMGEGATNDDLTFQRQKSFFDLYVNEETSRYPFRIMAIKEIMSNPRKYGFNLSENDFYRTPKTKKVTVSAAIPNLAAWAESQGSTYKKVKLANPWILKRTLPAGSYEIDVPVE
jgi:membrane-bound lytic murein transglycosylase D